MLPQQPLSFELKHNVIILAITQLYSVVHIPSPFFYWLLRGYKMTLDEIYANLKLVIPLRI